MNDVTLPKDNLEQWERWKNDWISRMVSAIGRKIDVDVPFDLHTDLVRLFMGTPCWVCRKPIENKAYALYSACSAKCEEIASSQADEAQDV